MKKSSPLPTPERMPYYKKKGTMADRCNWDAVTRDVINKVKRVVRKCGQDGAMDMCDAMAQRRRQAVVRYADRIIDRYKEVPGLEYEHRDDTGEQWINLNFTPVNTYNLIEEHACLLCAAAIWILDEVMADDSKRFAMYELLPVSFDELDDAGYMPEIWHPYYDKELIKSVMYVLNHRDKDEVIIEMDDEETERLITNSQNARGEKCADGPHRKAFDGLMALIPHSSVERAAKLFEMLFRQWTDRYFLCAAPLIADVRKKTRRLNGIVDEYNAACDDLVKLEREMMAWKPAPPPQKGKPAFNPLLADPFRDMPDKLKGVAPDLFPKTPAGGLFQPVDKLAQIGMRMTGIQERCNKVSDALSEAEKKIDRFTIDLLRMGYIRQDWCRKKYGEEAAENMVPLDIPRPFEVCFALIWLTDRGNDMPWLYGCGCGLMEEVAESLPWGVCDYDEQDDPIWAGDGGAEEGKQMSFLSEGPKKKTSGTSAIPDWFERKYVPEVGDEEEQEFNRSLSQILYEETGCLVPRDMHRYDIRRKAVRKYGVPPRETSMLLQLFTVLSGAKRQRMALNLGGHMMKDWSGADDAEAGENEDGGAEDTGITFEELAGKLKQAREENKKLRSSLHESEKASREARKELEGIRMSAELDRRELADLRELVYNWENGEEEAEETAGVDENAFPYEVRKDTVVFGGHETWLKAIRPMLTGSIRFIDKDVNFNVNIVRGAEMVWIQANALSHSLYYRIVDAARQYKKTVRYFTCASAAKGAMQVMEADR